MRLHRFFINELIGERKSIYIFDRDLLHQWKNVFRLKKDNRFILLDNTGWEFNSHLSLLSKEKAEIIIDEKQFSINIPQKDVWLFAALIKKDSYEWILEKGTELGVTHFVPIIAERTEKKNLDIIRSKKIIKEASEQSGRGIQPILHDMMHVKNIFLTYKNQNNIVFQPTGKVFDQSSYINQKNIALFIGPEGGWSDKEIDFFKMNNVSIESLGPQILRAETAALAAVTLLIL